MSLPPLPQDLYGVILYGENIKNAEQLKKLCKNLQEKGIAIYIDQEGGGVARLAEEKGFFTGTAPATLAQEGVNGVRKEAIQQAKQLASLGITNNCAPCVDLNIGRYIGSRSYSTKVEEVIACATAFIEEHRAQGIKTCLKHFPGHGSSNGDTHKGWVDITTTWRKEELEPYRQLIKKGLVDEVMVAHVVHGSFDPELPASLSPRVIGDLLRNDLGFTGTVITDDLSMDAIPFPVEEATERALEAGADIALAKNYCLSRMQKAL